MRCRFMAAPRFVFFTAALLTGLPACKDQRAETSSSAKLWEEFSGQKAFEHVQRLVDFGPRPPASEAIEKSRDYIVKQLEQFGWSITRQEFADDTPRGKIRFVNLIANFGTKGNA